MLAKALLVSALASYASAQINTTFVTGLGQYLESAGFTALAQAVNSSVSTPGTQFLLSNINGTSKTLLAPSNAAFAGLAANATTNTTLLGERLSYHLLSGNFTADTFSYAPNHTIARTYLADPSLVHLEGNKTQAIAFSIINNRTQVLNQNTVVTITNTSKYENLLIHWVDAVVDVPGTASAAFATWNLTVLPQVLNTLNYTDAINNAQGITIFAPNDAAFQKAAAQLQAIQANTTATGEIVANHLINGTSAYSSLLGGNSFTSAVGNAFSFSTNGSGTYVTSGNATAQVVQSDIILQNGVLHIIDTVLYNNQSNPSAASSANNAATSSAGSGGQQTGAVGGGANAPTETGAVGGQTSKSSAMTRVDLEGGKLAVQAAIAFVGVLGGASLLI